MNVKSLDHLVLTVRDLQAAIDFYTRALGMAEVTFGGGRKALAFGSQKINLHLAGREFEPKADRPTPGSADLCFLTDTPVEQYAAGWRRSASRWSRGRWRAPAPSGRCGRSTCATRT